LLRLLAARVLPPTFDERRKQGFSIPLVSWLRSGPWQSRFHEILLGPESTLFDHTVVKSLMDGVAKGRSNGERLFALVLFESWRKEYGVSI
jgi:asparagine synthase (glutamine-hydrolysing)